MKWQMIPESPQPNAKYSIMTTVDISQLGSSLSLEPSAASLSIS